MSFGDLVRRIHGEGKRLVTTRKEAAGPWVTCVPDGPQWGETVGDTSETSLQAFAALHGETVEFDPPQYHPKLRDYDWTVYDRATGGLIGRMGCMAAGGNTAKRMRAKILRAHGHLIRMGGPSRSDRTRVYSGVHASKPVLVVGMDVRVTPPADFRGYDIGRHTLSPRGFREPKAEDMRQMQYLAFLLAPLKKRLRLTLAPQGVMGHAT